MTGASRNIAWLLRTLNFTWVLFVLVAVHPSIAHAFVENTYSGTFAAPTIDAGKIAFNSDNTASLADFDRGMTDRVDSKCGRLDDNLDNTPDNAPAGLAQAHDVSAGASGVAEL